MNVVAIGIDKVQTFLYDAIHSPTQKNQTNSGTLSAVMGASRMISNEFYEVIGLEKKSETAAESGAVKEPAFFADHVREPLLKCSGTYVFTTDLEGTELKNALKGVFEKYYTDYNGRLLVKYVHFEKDPKTDREKLDAILKGKKLLKSNACMSQVLEDNADLLFRFHAVSDATIKNRKSGKSEAELVNADDGTPIKWFFVDNIDRLSPEGKEGNQDHFRIAVIKADLDGMGDFFSRIENLNVYEKVSNILNEKISLLGIKEQIGDMQKVYPKFLVYPLYVAGDDILFAVDASNLVLGIKLCEQMLEDINKEIMKIKPYKLTLSIGIDFTFNNEPIRYYHQRVKAQLDLAKKAKNDVGQNTPKIKICINNSVFQIKDEKKKSRSLPTWEDFMSDVLLLQDIDAVGFATHHFLYGFLNKLTDPAFREKEAVIKLSNAILYHLSPKHIENPDLGKLELQLLYSLYQVISVKMPRKGKKLQWELEFSDTNCAKLEAYVRLLLLFSDSRYNMSDEIKKREFERDKIRSMDFNRTMRYIFYNNFKSNDMRDLFIRKEYYFRKSNKPGTIDQKNEVYQTLRLSHNVFYRIKRMGINAKGNADMINLIVDRSEGEYANIQRDRYSPPPSLPFNPQRFVKVVDAAGKSSIWNEDCLDSLLIFYRYKELLIRYRMLYPSHKREESETEKGGEQ